MSKKLKKPPLSFLEKLRKIKNSGLNYYKPLEPDPGKADVLPTLEERLEQVFQVYNKAVKNPTHMIFFIMYDIENNKIRTQIAKYLKKKGCFRVQKSIFLAKAERKKFDEIHKTLKEVQEIYDNNDSILLVPVSSDEMRAMKVLGQQVDTDIILGNKNTLFF